VRPHLGRLTGLGDLPDRGLAGLVKRWVTLGLVHAYLCSPLGRQFDLSRGRLSPSVYRDPVRKEVIQPQVPLRLPCYDLVPITSLAFGAVLLAVGHSDFERSPLSWLDGQCVQGSGTYSPRHG
jgi:hypothetical protein